MSVKTNNIYGKITISNETIEKFISHVALDSYGIVEFAYSNAKEFILSFLRIGNVCKGVKVRANGDRVSIGVTVIVKYGVSIKAVVEALKEMIKYRVEKFTGMIVENMDVKVVGIEK